MKRLYFVSYIFVDNDNVNGTTSCEVITKRKITGFKNIQEITDHIKERNNYKEVVIINWRRFEK